MIGIFGRKGKGKREGSQQDGRKKVHAFLLLHIPPSDFLFLWLLKLGLGVIPGGCPWVIGDTPTLTNLLLCRRGERSKIADCPNQNLYGRNSDLHGNKTKRSK